MICSDFAIEKLFYPGCWRRPRIAKSDKPHERTNINVVGSGARLTEPEVPLKFVGEFVPALMFGEPGGLPNAPESVNELTPFFGRAAPVNTIESFEPLNVMVMFVALGLKNGPTNGLFGAAIWSNVKSGVTAPGSEPKPEVAISKE